MIKVKELSSKHRKTLADVLTTPPKSGIKWDDVVSLINKLGGRSRTATDHAGSLSSWAQSIRLINLILVT